MAQLNKVYILGRLSKDPELKQTTTGKSVCSFTIAVDKPGKDNGASFVDCEAWQATGEFVGKYLVKGDLALVEGRLDQQSWEKDGQKRYALRVVASEVQALTKRKDSTPRQEQLPTEAEVQQPVDLSEVPF